MTLAMMMSFSVQPIASELGEGGNGETDGFGADNS
jgi:hypothetical protein